MEEYNLKYNHEDFPFVARKEMKHQTLIIRLISKELARKICLKHHYSHKWGTNFGIHNFGVYLEERPNECLGVASFGEMMNPNSYSSISSQIEKEEIIELNRMWFDDVLVRNTETTVLSIAFKWFKKNTKIKIVQSFSDGRLGCGVVYRASNFKYYGYTLPSFYEDKVHGIIEFHSKFDNTENLVSMVGYNLGLVRGYYDVFKTKSHRYLYCIDKKYEKTIKLKELPYPPYDRYVVYKDNFVQSRFVIARCYLTCTMLEFDCAKDFMEYLKEHFTQEQIDEALERASKNERIAKRFKTEKSILNMKTKLNNFDTYFEPLDE